MIEFTAQAQLAQLEELTKAQNETNRLLGEILVLFNGFDPIWISAVLDK